MNIKVFLGGTCNDTTWREKVISKLEIPYFNPVVEDWTSECQEIEKQEKLNCDIHLYVITKEMTGVFSIAEAVESVFNEDKDVYFHVIPDGFDEYQLLSLKAVGNIIEGHWGYVTISNDLTETINEINDEYKDEI